MKSNIKILSLCWAIFNLMACSHEQAPPITIGINPWPGYEYLYLAKAKGFYQQENVPVKIIQYGSLSDVRRGYERGKLDGMAVTLIEVLQAKQNSNRDPAVFLVADYSNGSDIILARDPIKSVAQLKGKRVATEIGSLPVFILGRALALNGLTMNDVKLVSLEQLAAEEAYQQGKVDAIVTYPPVSVRLKSRKDTHQIFSSAEIPGEVVDVVTIENSILKSRPEDIQAIIRAWQRALQFARSHPQEAYEIMAKREGITPEEFQAASAGLTLVDADQQANYFGNDGILRRVLGQVSHTLKSIGVLKGDDHSNCCIPEKAPLL